ncbi:LRRIQ4 [Branchiostoma lanceolatum]|uniref:Leucine-rich repeat protein SHOC-2 n=1 Tax=Branchiostoma lanceolatum TaxID=7740 RepID=A0A8K0EIS2_BRALA|nr:LRRIQ4 [Branchiostoma lanceolatum]
MEEKEQELRDAAGLGDEVRVQQLLAEGVDVNAADDDGRTALHSAAQNGHTGTVQALLKAGATVDARTMQHIGNRTPLHLAAENGHTGPVQALLAAGADINARDIMKKTPLHHAANDGHPECVKVLLKAGANTVIGDEHKKTAEDLGVQEDVLKVFQFFKVSPKYTPLQPKVVDNLFTIDLSGKGLTSVPAEVFDAKNVERLVLSDNRLTSISEEIGQLQKLRDLKLDNNLLTQLPQAITTLPDLQHIDLSANRLKEIPDVVCSLLQLKTLYVGSNPLKCLPDKISQLTGLRRLEIDSCRFDEFPRQVLQLEGLVRLRMANWAGEGKPSPVPEDIGRLKNLHTLYLDNSGLDSLPDGVGELGQLTHLDISRNRFTSVPEQIMNLPNIGELILHSNRISHLPLTLPRLYITAVYGNPLTYPPPDVCKKGAAAIMDFLRREVKEKEDKELGKLFFRFSQKVTQRPEVEALATVAGLKPNERTSILGKDKANPSYQAHNVLLKWIEKDREASMDKLQQELSDIGMGGLAEEVGRIKADRLKRPADEAGGPPAKRPAAGESSRVGHQEEQQTKGKIRQAEQKLVQMQHHSETQQAMVSSLRAEVTRLTDKEERAQKVLLDHKQEIQQLQEANVAMATRVDSLLQDNEKLRSQVVLLGGEQQADEETTQVLERTILMFTENVLQKSGQSKPDLQETELATSAGNALLTKLSCRLGSDWRRLGAKLGVPQPRLDSIQQAGYSNAIQRACKVLTVWMCGGDHGLPHDLKQLETALADIERTDLLDIVKTAYKDYIKEMPEVEVEPEASVDEQGVTTWSVQLPGRGKYVYKHTDLGIVTPCPVQLTYRTVNPSEHWPENEDWELIGPLFHIQCNHDDGVPVELLLPHILDLSQEDGSALATDEAKAAHVVAGNTTLHPADVTPTHFVTRHQKGSLWGSVLRKLRALSVNRRGLLTLFKTSLTQDAVDVKAHIVSNTKDIVKALQEDMSQLDPKFYWWDSITCPGLRPHQIYCLQASVENGTLDLADPEPPSGLEYEDTLDCNRIYPSFHMTVQRRPDSERLQLNLQLYPQAESGNVVCSCRRRLYGGAAAGHSSGEDVQRHFHFIKENVSVHWKDLAGFLGFRRPDIDTIQYKPANRDAKDCCMDMLEQWRRRRGDAATLQVILRALTEAGLQDVVDQLSTM